MQHIIHMICSIFSKDRSKRYGNPLKYLYPCKYHWNTIDVTLFIGKAQNSIQWQNHWESKKIYSIWVATLLRFWIPYIFSKNRFSDQSEIPRKIVHSSLYDSLTTRYEIDSLPNSLFEIDHLKKSIWT